MSAVRGSLHFTKMEGIGNDYIYLNCLERSPSDPGELARKLSDRHFGVGSDGLILILPSEVADFRMRMFNVDGSEGENCGNALRCVGKYLYDKGITGSESFTIEVLGGRQALELKVEDGVVSRVRVNLGEPRLACPDIPVLFDKSRLIDEPLRFGDRVFETTCVSMGNPHAVLFIDEITDDLVNTFGPIVENDQRFPERVNVEFVRRVGPAELEMRVWERGCGETLACGTGAGAICVAGVLTERTERSVVIHLKGGDLALEWGGDGNVYKEGPAQFVFEGVIAVDGLEWVPSK